MTTTAIVRPVDVELRAALRLAAAFGAAKLLLQIALTLWTRHLGYGYFRDEFYYIACGRHLAWGFVDHGPVVALQARVAAALFGTSLLGIRMLSAAAEAIAVALTGIGAWALGGRRPAQALAMLGILVAPITIAMGGFLSMNSCEPMFWTACVIARPHTSDTWPQRPRVVPARVLDCLRHQRRYRPAQQAFDGILSHCHRAGPADHSAATNPAHTARCPRHRAAVAYRSAERALASSQPLADA